MAGEAESCRGGSRASTARLSGGVAEGDLSTLYWRQCHLATQTWSTAALPSAWHLAGDQTWYPRLKLG